jgi:hypothetical protein
MPYLLILVFVALLVIFFLTKRKIGGFSSYRKRTSVMNSSEREFYLILKSALSDKFIVLSKVRIEDFVEVDRGLEWGKEQSFRGKIKSRHVDFLICDLLTTEPLRAIELDGYSHRDYLRIERDEFVDGLYQYIGLPVVHIKVGSNFYEEVERIKNLLISK